MNAKPMSPALIALAKVMTQRLRERLATEKNLEQRLRILDVISKREAKGQ